jgi:hypothetical protein
MTPLLNHIITHHPRIGFALLCAIASIPAVVARITSFGEI